MAALECEIVPQGQFVPPNLPEELNTRQKAFVCHYLETRNGTQSAKLAGYDGSDSVLAVTASRLLNHAKVKEAFESYFQGHILSANGVLSELSEMAFAPVNDPNIRPVDKIKSLELVGKFHRLFADKVETEVSLSDQDVERLTQSFVQACLAKRNEVMQLQGNEEQNPSIEP